MAAAFGIGTALIAAIWPAVRASRLSPIEALREDD
jgi:ABC-type antimicrobial peptide transport system permease subunit